MDVVLGSPVSPSPAETPPVPSAPPRPSDQPAAAAGIDRRLMRRSLHTLNRLMVPALRAGLGPWLGSPLGGWVLLARVRGRRTGLVREVPLSYLIADGSIWVVAGLGGNSQWLLNLRADPRVEVVLPGRTVACTAEVVTGAEERRRIIPRLVRVVGVPGYLAGIDPYRDPAERILGALADVPLVRLRAMGGPIVGGADDPGGLGWLWRQPVVLLLSVLAVRALFQLLRRLRHAAEPAGSARP
jgi:deazaflavin-dependent oxidoreductase (nitroreductase family)